MADSEKTTDKDETSKTDTSSESTNNTNSGENNKPEKSSDNSQNQQNDSGDMSSDSSNKNTNDESKDTSKDNSKDDSKDDSKKNSNNDSESSDDQVKKPKAKNKLKGLKEKRKRKAEEKDKKELDKINDPKTSEKKKEKLKKNRQERKAKERYKEKQKEKKNSTGIRGFINAPKNRPVRNNNGKVSKLGSRAKYVKDGVANKAKDKLDNTKLGQNLQKIWKKLLKVFKFIANNIKILLILAAIVIAISTIVIFGMSVAGALGQSPHYYCDTNAPDAIKRTTLYQQYCSEVSNFNVSSLNGHYIVQDGSGPCLSCSLLNLTLRYFDFNGINVFDYLWGSDGKIPAAGMHVSDKPNSTFRTTIVSSNINNPGGVLRYHANYDTNIPGFRWFANKFSWYTLPPGKDSTMANWGYMRDENINIDEFSMSDSFTIDIDANLKNENWTWDLSRPNNDTYTSWSVGSFTPHFEIEGIKCVLEGDIGSTSFNEISASDSNNRLDKLKEILTEGETSDIDGRAGVLLYYVKQDGGHHAVLITNYDPATNTFFIVDPGIGIYGGYEGPVKQDGPFSIKSHYEYLNSVLTGNPVNCRICAIVWCKSQKAALAG